MKAKGLVSNFSKNWAYSLILTVLYSTYILPITERLAFTPPTDRKGQVVAVCLKLLFATFLFLTLNFILFFIEKLKAKDNFYLTWFKYTGIYLVIMSVVLLLIYPGEWAWDEYDVVNAAKTYDLWAWQHYFTTIYYTFCMYLVPTAIGIIIVQVAFASLVVGYITARVKKLLKGKHLAKYVFLLFFLPPILLNNFYPLRPTIYSYIELLLLAKLIFLYFNKYKVTNAHAELPQYALLIMLVSLWRSEGIYYLILFPMLVIWLKLFNKRNYKTVRPYTTLMICAGIFFGGLSVTVYTANSEYELPPYINSLSMMLQEPLEGKDIDVRLKDIDKVTSVEILRKNPSFEEIPAYWEGAVRPDYQQHLGTFRKQYLYLVLHNPGVFLNAKFKTFMSANGFGPSLPFVNSSRLELQTYESGSQTNKVHRFVHTNYLSRPLNFSLKQEVTRKLLFLNKDGQFSFLSHVFWNVIPAIILLFVIGIKYLLSRQFFWVFIFSLVLIRALLLFLTAPANYFVYYLPVYISGYFLVMLSFLLNIDKRRPKKS